MTHLKHFTAVLIAGVFALNSCQKETIDTSTDSNSTEMTIGANYITIEAEATSSPLGDWEVVTANDPRYQNTGEAPTNGTHLEFTGNDQQGGPASSPLEYKFTVSKTGSYRLFMRLFQRRDGAGNNNCDEVYIKMAGNFTSGNTSYTTNELKADMEFFGRGVNDWGCAFKGDLNGVQEAVVYDLLAGEEYIFTLSGNAQRTNIDYFILVENNVDFTYGNNKDIAVENCPNYRPDWTNSVEHNSYASADNMTVGHDFIAIEAEATSSPLGNWEIVTASDPRYHSSGQVAPINGTHLEFTGNSATNGPADSPLEYKFTAPKTAAYRLGIRLFQRLEGAPHDQCNDVYIRMAGDFTTGNTHYTTTQLQNDMKFFGSGNGLWGAIYRGDLNNVREAVVYNLKAGEEYTLTISGRSQRANIDYILLFDESLDLTITANQDLAEKNCIFYRPDWQD